MNNFFKCLSPNKEDVSWGIYLNVVGREYVRDYFNHHSSGQNKEHYNNYRSGQILDEYRITYITEGEGVIESGFRKYPVTAGNIIICKPHEQIIYKPDSKIGWVENYISFKGIFADHIFKNQYIQHIDQIIDMGFREDVLDNYYKIFDCVLNETPGYQQVSSGIVIKLLGIILASRKDHNNINSRIEKIIQDACYYIRENVNDEIDFNKYAQDQNCAYSYFRNMFKKHTGLAPLQYHLDLRIKQSKDMLLNTDKNIKEICYDLGFNSVFYFSKAFKKKLGISPSMIRNKSKITQSKALKEYIAA
jgi:AraC-like DNA-binding protein